MREPKTVVEEIVDSSSDDIKINVYSMTISRYAWLELLDSPFIGAVEKFEMNTIIPSAYVMTHTPQELRKYNSKKVEELVNDAYDWADLNLKLDDVPELVKAILDQLNSIQKAAPSVSPKDLNLSAGSKKN